MCTPALEDSVIARYDIDTQRLKESELMLTAIADTLSIDGIFRVLRTIPSCSISPRIWRKCAPTPGS